MFCVMFGNLSDGFRPAGPFLSFDDAAAYCEGKEAWVMEMKGPGNRSDEVDTALGILERYLPTDANEAFDALDVVKARLR